MALEVPETSIEKVGVPTCTIPTDAPDATALSSGLTTLIVSDVHAAGQTGQMVAQNGHFCPDSLGATFLGEDRELGRV